MSVCVSFCVSLCVFIYIYVYMCISSVHECCAVPREVLMLGDDSEYIELKSFIKGIVYLTYICFYI